MNKQEFEKIYKELTPREQQISELYLAGKNDTEISKIILNSETTDQEAIERFRQTVRTHISNTCGKFKVSDRRDSREGLIRLFYTYKRELVSPDRRKEIGEQPLEFPEGEVPLNSYFYLSLPGKSEGYNSLEYECYESIQRAGALIRIKAPKLMGKTSLMSRILDRVQKNFEAHTVTINLEEADTDILASSEDFLKWFCSAVGTQLGLEEPSGNFWPDFAGNRSNCIHYFEKYLLSQINCPLILALDEVDRIFPFESAHEFFPVLRYFHERAKTSPVFQKLRIIIVHSTEAYIKLKTTESPFYNVGTPIELRDLNREEIQGLIYRHGLGSIKLEIDDIMKMIGGHPYLIRLALYHLAKDPSRNLRELLQKAPTREGIYQEHLLRLLGILQEDSGLTNAYKTVISTPNPIEWVELDPIQTFLLDSLGLVTKKNNRVKSRYLLYSQYFKNIL